MKPELYFDINSELRGGSLFRIKKADGATSFVYNHSTCDVDADDIEVFQTQYDSFEAFWQDFTKDKQWFFYHPLYVHPEQRAFIQEQLKTVNWKLQGDVKWQVSHQRQWIKVFNDSDKYYNPPSFTP